LVLVGSDLAIMERLTEYGRPLYDWAARILVIDPLTPADIAAIADLSPVEVFDAARRWCHDAARGDLSHRHRSVGPRFVLVDYPRLPPR